MENEIARVYREKTSPDLVVQFLFYYTQAVAKGEVAEFGEWMKKHAGIFTNMFEIIARCKEIQDAERYPERAASQLLKSTLIAAGGEQYWEASIENAKNSLDWIHNELNKPRPKDGP